MGVIIKQSIKNTIYAYIGAVIGFVNISLLMPKLLSPEEIGLINYIFSIILILSQFTSLGLNNITTRLFPYFRNKTKNHHGFFSLGLMVSGVGSLLTIILYFILKSRLLSGENNQVDLENFIFYVIPLTIITLFLNYFDTFFRALFNATIGMFLKEIITRVLNTLVIISYFFNWIDFYAFVFLYFLSYSLPTFILGLLLMLKGEFKLQRPRPFLIHRLKWTMISIAGFGLVTGFSNISVLQFDRIMLKSYMDLASIGIYTITFSFAMLIILPARSVKRIATMVIAESFKNNDLENIGTIYRKSTITQFIIGAYLFIGLWANIDNIILVIGPQYEAGRYVIFFIGLANLTEMLTGVNQAIIGTGKKYIYAAVFMLLMLAIIILTNWIFIPILGITGAALASFITVLTISIIRYLFVWNTFKLQPYSYKHLIILAIVFSTYFVTIYLPQLSNPYYDIVLKGIVISIIFAVLIYFTRVSEDINQKVDELILRKKNRK